MLFILFKTIIYTIVYINDKMAVKMLDLTGQPQRITFTESPPEEMSYAEAFWHSVRLQPTMESRLVSSDIKQRLRKNKKANSKSSKSVHFPSMIRSTSDCNHRLDKL